MDTNALLLSFLFGMIGFGMFSYGRKAGRIVPLGAGIALMVIPYFIPNPAILLIVCVALTAIPALLRNA